MTDFPDIFLKLFNFSVADPEEKQKTHTVKKGDTLYSIATANGISVDDLLKANNLNNKTTIQPGMVLTIPSSQPAQKTSPSVWGTNIVKESGFSVVGTGVSSSSGGIKGKYKKLAFHTVQEKETLSSIERKYELLPGELKDYNKLKTTNLKIGQRIRIPAHSEVGNVKTMQDVANVTGFSIDFLKKIEHIEVKGSTPEDIAKNRGKVEDDNVGSLTAGIGHRCFTDFEKKYFKGKHLNDEEVNKLFAKDIVKALNVIKNKIGDEAYDKMKPYQREALVDLVFNKGETFFRGAECADLRKAIQEGRYDDAATLLNYNKNKKGQKMAGLSKRRLMDIGEFCNGRFSSKVLRAAQKLYEEGLSLAKADGANAYDIKMYNEECQQYMRGKLKIKN